MTDLITVIIPVYKVEGYLDSCIESVVNQTFSNLEIILVDDGSPDRCGEICDNWGKKDKRIRVIHKENGGLSDARNAGLEYSQGQYVVFVDSDDCISPFMIDALYLAIKKNIADIAECNYLSFTSTIPDCEFKQDFEMNSYTAEEALSLLLEGMEFKYPVWNKIYRRGIIGDTRFEKGKLHEDVFFTYQIFGKSNRIIKIQQDLYFYRQRVDSIMGSSFTLRNLDALEARIRQYEYIKNIYPELSGKALRQLLGNCIFMGQIYLRNNDEKCREQALREIKAVFNEFYEKENFSQSMKVKFWFFLAKSSMKMCCRIRNLLRIGL